MKKITLIIIALSASLAHADFEINENAGKYIDVLDGEKVVARIMTAYDASTAEGRFLAYERL